MDNLQPSTFADRSPYLARLGDPSTWTGDWRRRGHYLKGEQQKAASERMTELNAMIVGMAVRRALGSQALAAVLGVSRESVDRRLRPLGLKNPPGQVGKPPRERAA